MSPRASAKAAMRAIARRWLALHEEIEAHDRELDRLVRERVPELMQAHGISTMTVAEMLILVGDDPDRIQSEAALAKLCGDVRSRAQPRVVGPPNGDGGGDLEAEIWKPQRHRRRRLRRLHRQNMRAGEGVARAVENRVPVEPVRRTDSAD